MRGKSLAALAAITASLAGSPLAQSSDACASPDGQDRAAIEALEWRYVHALDTLDADAYVRTFTPDGQLGTGPNAVKGAAGLRGVIAFMKQDAQERNKGRALPIELYHIMTNLYIEFVDSDHARVHYYWLALYAMPRPPAQQGGHERPPEEASRQPRVADAGRAVDHVVRVNGRWLIRLRDVWSRD